MKWLPLLALFLCAPSQPPEDSVCGGPKARQRMADMLYAQQDDFRGWVCDDECTREEFRKLIEYHEQTLRDRPKAVGCFVEQVQKPTNSATGVFVLENARPALELVFHGIGIGPTPDGERVHGFRVLVGSERQGPSAFVDYYYVWSGKSYVLRNSKPATDGKSEK